jgi:hypothetical protein
MQVDRSCALSIVIATHQAWPGVRASLDSVWTQARAVDGEVLIGDSSGDALPSDVADRYPGLCWIVEKDGSSFQLRALAMARARGEIVAITEDHCIAHEEWCDRILRAHAAHPEAGAIGGAVNNATAVHAIDRACFLIANGPFMPPLESGPADRIALQANASYKRRALPAGERSDLGVMEMLHNERLRGRGDTLVADNSIVVDHYQSLGFATTSSLHFHNGRSIAGFRLEHMRAAERWLRLGGCAVLPIVMFWRTMRTALSKRQGGLASRAAPFVAWLLCCHASGEFVGYLAGAGKSPRFLHIG